MHQPQVRQGNRAIPGAVFRHVQPGFHSAIHVLGRAFQARQPCPACHESPGNARAAVHSQNQGKAVQPHQPGAAAAGQFGTGQHDLRDRTILPDRILRIETRAARFAEQAGPNLPGERGQQRTFARLCQTGKAANQGRSAAQFAGPQVALAFDSRQLVAAAQRAFRCQCANPRAAQVHPAAVEPVTGDQIPPGKGKLPFPAQCSGPDRAPIWFVCGKLEAALGAVKVLAHAGIEFQRGAGQAQVLCGTGQAGKPQRPGKARPAASAFDRAMGDGLPCAAPGKVQRGGKGGDGPGKVAAHIAPASCLHPDYAEIAVNPGARIDQRQVQIGQALAAFPSRFAEDDRIEPPEAKLALPVGAIEPRAFQPHLAQHRNAKTRFERHGRPRDGQVRAPGIADYHVANDLAARTNRFDLVSARNVEVFQLPRNDRIGDSLPRQPDHGQQQDQDQPETGQHAAQPAPAKRRKISFLEINYLIFSCCHIPIYLEAIMIASITTNGEPTVNRGV